MRIVSICSSSDGNCTYIESGGKGLLVDVGCSYTMLVNGLKLAGRDITNVNAVFITHEHTDHIAGLAVLTKKHELPIYSSEGTVSQILSKNRSGPLARFHLLNEIESAPVNLRVNAFHTPHDSAESVCYTFSNNENKIAVCTDLGKVTPEVRSNLIGSRFVLIESNYDLQMLINNRQYSSSLKARIRSERGHLSNGDCAAFVRELVSTGTVSVLLGHLSKNNNTPEIAERTVEVKLSEAGAFRGRDYMLDTADIIGKGKAFAI